jgi:hypothetical protein
MLTVRSATASAGVVGVIGVCALTVGFAGAAAPSALSGRHKVPTGVPDHRYPGSSIEYPSGSIVPSGAPIRLPDAGAVTDAGNAT